MGKGILSGGNSSLAATNSKISSHNEDPSAHPQLVSTLEDYVDNKISEIPAPDVSGAISQHNSEPTAHADIREELSNVESAVSTAQTTANSAQAAAVNAQNTANGKANASHTHTKSQITDFPTSMTPTAHSHGAGDITSGTLPVARGGTGQTSLANLKTSMGIKRVSLFNGTTAMTGSTRVAVTCSDTLSNYDIITIRIWRTPNSSGSYSNSDYSHVEYLYGSSTYISLAIANPYNTNHASPCCVLVKTANGDFVCDNTGFNSAFNVGTNSISLNTTTLYTRAGSTGSDLNYVQITGYKFI